MDPRQQTSSEETLNSFSHGIGLVLALIGTPPLLMKVAELSDTRYFIGTGIFTVTMISLYFASTLYHALRHGKAKRVFKVIEHSAIFLLIAGTYTPLTLGVLRGGLGWLLLGLIWSLAVFGIWLKVTGRWSHPVISTGLYVVMGWLILVAINPLYMNFSGAGMFWLVTGGVAYTVGVAFFATDSRLRYGHFIWHLFVMLGTGCHYLAVLEYAY